MKGQETKHYWVTFRGFCRNCWKRQSMDIDCLGLNMEQLRQAVQKAQKLCTGCCKNPDVRLSA